MMMSTRGLNAAKDMADYFNGIHDGSVKASSDIQALSGNIFDTLKKDGDAQAKGLLDSAGNITEAGIRSITSKGMVTADAFFDAMSKKYADHAKDANETYTGAMSNVQAALSRIGAEFATPWREAMRQIAVTVIPVIKTIQKVLQPVYDRFQWFMDKYVAKVQQFLGPVGKFLDQLSKYQDAVTKRNKKLEKFEKEHGKKSTWTSEEKKEYDEIANSLTDKFTKVQRVLNVITDMIKIPWRILKLIINQVGVLAKTAREIFPDLPKFKDFAKTIENIRKHIKFIKLKDAFNGDYISKSVRTVNNVLKVFVNIINTARIGIKNFAIIISPIFKPIASIFKLIGRNIMDFIKLLNGGMEKIREFDESEEGQTMVKNLHDAIDNVMTPIANFIDGLKSIGEIISDVKEGFENGFKNFDGVNFFEQDIANLVAAWEGFKQGIEESGIKDVIDGIKDAFSKLREIISDSWNKLFENDKVKGAADKVQTGLEKVKNVAVMVGKVVGGVFKKGLEFLTGIVKQITKFAKNGFVKSVTKFIQPLQNIFSDKAKSPTEKFKEMVEYFKKLGPAATVIGLIATAFKKIKDAINTVVNTFKEFGLGVKTEIDLPN